jgi:hypothetical protein
MSAGEVLKTLWVAPVNLDLDELERQVAMADR